MTVLLGSLALASCSEVGLEDVSDSNARETDPELISGTDTGTGTGLALGLRLALGSGY